MTRTASAHLGQLEAAYSEHVRALHAHLGVTAVVVPPGADDDILPGPPTEYHLRAQLESGVVVDAYEHVQWGIDPTAKCPDGRWAVPYEDLKAPCGLFAPRGLDRPGWWCVDVKRWELCALNDSLAERNARSAGHPARPVKITLRLGRLSDAKSTDRSRTASSRPWAMLSIPLSARARLNRTLLSENPHPQLLSAEKDE